MSFPFIYLIIYLVSIRVVFLFYRANEHVMVKFGDEDRKVVNADSDEVVEEDVVAKTDRTDRQFTFAILYALSFYVLLDI